MKYPSLIKFLFWFSIGVAFGLFFIITSFYLVFERINEGKVYPWIKVGGTDVGGKTRQEVVHFFSDKNERFEQTIFHFFLNGDSVYIVAKELDFGFDSDLLADQAYSLGRSGNMFSDVGIMIAAYGGEINLPVSYRFSDDVLRKKLKPIEEKVTVEPTDALFNFNEGRVIAFKPSSDGQKLDFAKLHTDLEKRFALIGFEKSYNQIDIQIPIEIVKPKITTENVNNFGIKELLASGSSAFRGSIPNRVHNISLAASKINGVLIAPNDMFSFNKALGDVSKFTGYKEAYIIKDGKTVLGDGGGVCQVSTTLFRALLNSGLPILERYPHSYRVSYYEQGSPVGLDATIYSPSYDLKFKNDTGYHILIQAYTDPAESQLQFNLYGTKDNREVILSSPVITNQTPAPPDLYQDDPTLPVGTVKQVDFKAAGAQVVFSREVKKDGKTIISENFRSNYRPWQAVFLRGTKE